jgi:hypothetical protein
MIYPTEPRKNLNTSQKIKEKVYELSINSTSHGVPQALRTPHVSLKILWTLCFLALAVLCALIVIDSINEYFAYDVVTKIRINDKKTLEFPTVTICHTSPFSTLKGMQLLKSMISNETNKNLNETNLTSLDYLNNKFNTGFLNALYYVKNANQSEDLKKSMGLSIQDMLFYCKFSNLECNYTNFKWHYDFLSGNCYQFNAGVDSSGNFAQPYSTSEDGEFGGLSLILFIGEALNSFCSNGLKIFIENVPTKLENYFEIKPNSKTNIALYKVSTRKSPHPYSDCSESDSFIFKETQKLYQTYSQKACKELFFQKLFVEICFCYSTTTLNIFNSKPCLTTDELDCATKVYQMNTEKYKWLLECPNECQSTSYEYTYSASEYSGERYYQEFKNQFNISEEDVLSRKFNKGKNGLILNVYFPQLKYTEVSETPKVGVISLISNIGGTLGLFLGISLLSFVEIVEIFFEIVFILFTKKNKLDV